MELPKLENVHILGQPAKVEEATEPTNMIWENRQFTPMHRLFIALFVSAIIVVCLLLAFGSIIYLKQVYIEFKAKYETVTCSDYTAVYNSTLL